MTGLTGWDSELPHPEIRVWTAAGCQPLRVQTGRTRLGDHWSRRDGKPPRPYQTRFRWRFALEVPADLARLDFPAFWALACLPDFAVAERFAGFALWALAEASGIITMDRAITRSSKRRRRIRAKLCRKNIPTLRKCYSILKAGTGRLEPKSAPPSGESVWCWVWDGEKPLETVHLPNHRQHPNESWVLMRAAPRQTKWSWVLMRAATREQLEVGINGNRKTPN